MVPTRRMKLEALEESQKYRTRQATLSADEMIEEKLTHLQAFIGQLKRTPHGCAEIQRRIKRFGNCQRIAGESSSQFYGKLRHWLDRDIPSAKTPRLARRQADDI